jgi:hypothetical protein
LLLLHRLVIKGPLTRLAIRSRREKYLASAVITNYYPAFTATGEFMSRRRIFLISFLSPLLIAAGAPVRAQSAPTGDAKQIYNALKTFQLGGGSRAVDNLVFKRDRGEIIFVSGTLYFATPVAGHVEGAVFIGDGKFSAATPPVKFEKESIRQRLKADSIESDFKTAVLRFTDDTFGVLGAGSGPGVAPGEAQKLASESGNKLLKETGANIAARLAVSILNNERPGIFTAEFDRGRRGHFMFFLDPQERIPSQVFDINGGEKGLIYGFASNAATAGVWTAFYSEDDYAKRRVDFSDASDQVAIRRHDMDFDAHVPGNRCGSATGRTPRNSVLSK